MKTPLPPAAPIKACITTEEEADIRQTKAKKPLLHLADHIVHKNVHKPPSRCLIVLHSLRETITKVKIISLLIFILFLFFSRQ